MKKIFFITTWMMLLLIQTRFVMAEDTTPPTPATPVATQLEEEKPSKTPEELKADLINKTQNTPDKTFLVKGDNKFVNLEREEERFLRDQDKVLVAQNINKELEEKLNEMKEIKNQLSKDVNKRVSVNDHIKQLVTLYESISAEQATQIIKQLPSALSVSILSMMNPKKSSKILATMEPHMAADMSKKILKEPQKLALGGTR